MCQGILECEVLVGTRSAEGIMASGHVNRIKGRTHGCTDQCCKTVKKALAKPEPSTHGTFRTWRDVRLESVMRTKSGRPPTTPNLWVHALVRRASQIFLQKSLACCWL